MRFWALLLSLSLVLSTIQVSLVAEDIPAIVEEEAWNPTAVDLTPKGQQAKASTLSPNTAAENPFAAYCTKALAWLGKSTAEVRTRLEREWHHNPDQVKVAAGLFVSTVVLATVIAKIHFKNRRNRQQAQTSTELAEQVRAHTASLVRKVFPDLSVRDSMGMLYISTYGTERPPSTSLMERFAVDGFDYSVELVFEGETSAERPAKLRYLQLSLTTIDHQEVRFRVQPDGQLLESKDSVFSPMLTRKSDAKLMREAVATYANAVSEAESVYGETRSVMETDSNIPSLEDFDFDVGILAPPNAPHPGTSD